MKHAHILIILLTAMIIINSNALESYAYQSSCGSYQDYRIDTDTTWQDQTICANNITVGNSTQRIIFNITNTTIYMKDKFYMGGNNPSNVSINSSTIYFESIIGVHASVLEGDTPDQHINTSQYITMDDTTDKSSPSRLEIRDSTIRGINYTHRFSGMTIYSYGLGVLATHTLILDNVNISYAGGNNLGGYGYYAVDAVTSYAPWYLSNSSRFNQVKIYYCGKGLHLPSNMNVTNSMSYRGIMPFYGGMYWDNLTILDSWEPYPPSNGGIVRNSYIRCNWAKLDIPYTGRNVVLEYSRIYNSALNAGDGGGTSGNNNIVRHCQLDHAGMGSRTNGTLYLNVTSKAIGYDMAINIGGHHQTVENSTIYGGMYAPGIRLYLHESTPSYNGKQTGTTIRNTLINDTHYGIKIEDANNGTFENIDITNMKMLYAKGFPDGYGLYIKDSSNLRFTDINMSGGFYGAGGGVYATQYITLNSDNSNLTFESCKFDGKRADMVIDTDGISITHLDIDQPRGLELVNLTFESNSVNTGNITITFINLNPENKHIIKKDGTYYWNTSGWATNQTYLYPESTGNLSFTNADWSIHTFTIEELPRPNITAWQTNATNASTTTDTMFLALQGEDISFNVTVEDISEITYQWTVNKMLRQESDPGFIFNVPQADCEYNPVSCIWEIHLRINDTYGSETHIEWLVSNLTRAQAPDVFESFTDAKYNSRTEPDPWGREQTEWNKTLDSPMNISLDRYYARTTDLQVKTTDTSDNVMLRIPSNATRGTWFIRYRWWPNDAYTASYNSWTGLDFTPVRSTNNTAYISLFNVIDGHWWFAGGYTNISRNYFSFPYANMVGSQITSAEVTGTVWHNITIIRDEDGYVYTYLDGSGVRWSMSRTTEIPDCEYFEVNLRTHYPYYLEIDDIEIYPERYYTQDSRIYYDPEEDAIIINGHNVTLNRIYDKISNESIFNYTTETRTATSYKDLKLMPQTNIQIRDSTLRMHSESDGDLKFRYGNDVNMIIENSTITSTNNYYYLFERFGQSYSNTAIQITGSIINNTGGISSDAVNSLYLVNSSFTNLHGTTPINIYFRRPTHKRLIKNCTFTGTTGTEQIVLQGGRQFEEISSISPGIDIIDSTFDNINLYPRYDWPYTYSPCRPIGIANIINTDSPSILYDGTITRDKYYLDVHVKNITGSSIEGAVVIPVNNQDSNHTSENLMTGKTYVQTGDQVDYTCCYETDDYKYFWDGSQNKGQLTNSISIWTRANINRMAATNSDGHTPLPRDEEHTLVLTDTQSNIATNYTYNITAIELTNSGTRIATINNTIYVAKAVNIIYPNGTIIYENGAITKIGHTYNIDPNETWRRANPNTYNNTIEIIAESNNEHYINITANPTTESVTLVVNSYNYSSPAGETILNFTAQSQNSNNVNFTICDLNPATYYTIKKDNIYHATRPANASGCLNFTNSVWSEHTFTIKETQTPIITIMSPANITYGSRWVWANVSIDENVSSCLASLNGNQNQSMSKLTERYLYKNISISTEGTNKLDVYCNNTIGYMSHEEIYFSIDSISGCYPPNTGTWTINRTLICQDNEAHFHPNLLIGTNGSVIFNHSTTMNLGAIEILNGSNFTLSNSEQEARIRGNITSRGTTIIENSNILLHGNITIHDNITLSNMTLRMNSTQTITNTGYFNINILSGATLNADKTTITRGENQTIFWGRLISYGTMVINNTRIEYTSGGNAGGVYIDDPTNRTKIYNTVFYDDSANVILKANGGIIEFHNITSGQGTSYALSSIGSIVYVYDSTMLATVSVGYSGKAYMINTTMGNTWHGTGSGEIYRQWYLDTYVRDTNSNPVPSAVITADNYSDVEESAGSTDSSGFERLILTEYSQVGGGGLNAAKSYMTPHTISVQKTGYTTSTTTINLTQNHSVELNITLSLSTSSDDSSSSGGSSPSSGGSSGGAALPITPTQNETNETETQNPITGNIIDTGTEDNTTKPQSNTLKEQAESLINEVKAIIEQYTGIRYLDEAGSRLNRAIDAYETGDYESSITLAQEAKELALNAGYIQSQSDDTGSSITKYIIYGSIAIIIIGIIILIIKNIKNRNPESIKNDPEESIELQKKKLQEIESYISQIMPIVTEMSSQNASNQKYMDDINTIEAGYFESKAILDSGNTLDENRIDDLILRLTGLKNSIESSNQY